MRRNASLPTLVPLVALLLAVGCGSPRSLPCEDAVAHIAECCPAFDPTFVRCDDQAWPFERRPEDEVYISPAAAAVISGQSCAEVGRCDECRRGHFYPSYDRHVPAGCP